MKCKIEIIAGELPVLNNLLQAAFVRLPMPEVKEDPMKYCALACLYEVYEKVRTTRDDDRIFKTRAAIKPIKITLTRPQALSLDIALNISDGILAKDLKKGDYTWDLARRICEQIYLTYYGA